MGGGQADDVETPKQLALARGAERAQAGAEMASARAEA
jgi:hypothetical protein